MKLSVKEQIELVESKSTKKLKEYLREGNLLSKRAIDALFHSKSAKLIKTYINEVYTEADEFAKYQVEVMKYGSRETVARYHFFHDMTADGEIALINRNEIESFSYYVANHDLSDEAFSYLIYKRSSALAYYYLENKMLTESQVKILMSSHSIKCINAYIELASASELDLASDVLVNTKDEKLIKSVYKGCQRLRPWINMTTILKK